MAKTPNGIETLPKISTGCVRRTNVTDRRQTDGFTTTFSSLISSSDVAETALQSGSVVLWPKVKDNILLTI